MSIEINNETYATLSDIMNDPSIVSPDIKAEVEFETALIGKLIEAREEMGLSQRELAAISGIKQPAIARLEKGAAVPKVDTLIRLLVPLGKTLAIVPLEDNK
ncbi:MAG: helix-turn-helix transcriptional regulator [Ruminococcus sp.]|nr:helix-turn-helix transcriptional regulator [Ruminococcus sp.]MCM1480552.1 helix-turn-helix transcriptional regulator [Muribaculaceae bacterium]